MKDDPKTPAYRVWLGESLLRSGQARRHESDALGAVADWTRADTLLEDISALAPSVVFSTLAATPRSLGRLGLGVPAGKADAEAAKALALLSEFGGDELPRPRHLPQRGRSRPAPRPDFRLLLMDLALNRPAGWVGYSRGTRDFAIAALLGVERVPAIESAGLGYGYGRGVSPTSFGLGT